MLTLTKLEQAAFLLQSDDITVAVDIGSYTSEESLEKAGNPQASLVTHIHPDHFSEVNLKQLAAPVYTVNEVAEAMESPEHSLHIHAEGDEVAILNTPFSVVYTASDHGPKVGPVENVGFLIKSPKASVYFLGDMAIGSPAPADPFDVLLIPVGNNGYTFDPEQAVEHIKALDWHGLTIPVHYNSHMNPESGMLFAELAGDFCQVKVLEVGESIILSGEK